MLGGNTVKGYTMRKGSLNFGNVIVDPEGNSYNYSTNIAEHRFYNFVEKAKTNKEKVDAAYKKDLGSFTFIHKGYEIPNTDPGRQEGTLDANCSLTHDFPLLTNNYWAASLSTHSCVGLLVF